MKLLADFKIMDGQIWLYELVPGIYSVRTDLIENGSLVKESALHVYDGPVKFNIELDGRTPNKIPKVTMDEWRAPFNGSPRDLREIREIISYIVYGYIYGNKLWDV